MKVGGAWEYFPHSLLNFGKCSSCHHCVFHRPSDDIARVSYSKHTSPVYLCDFFAIKLTPRRFPPILPSNRKRTGRLVRARQPMGARSIHSGRFVYLSFSPFQKRRGLPQRKRVRLPSCFVGFASRHLSYIFGRRFQR